MEGRPKSKGHRSVPDRRRRRSLPVLDPSKKGQRNINVANVKRSIRNLNPRKRKRIVIPERNSQENRKALAYQEGPRTKSSSKIKYQ